MATGKQYIISTQQIDVIWKVLAEVPAGKALNAIDVLRSLELVEEKNSAKEVKK